MLGLFAKYLIGLLRSLYGITTSVVSSVINTVVTGTFIVRQTGGTAGTNEVQISENGTDTIITPKQGAFIVTHSSDGGYAFKSDGNNSATRIISNVLYFCSGATLATIEVGLQRLATNVIGLANSGGNGGWLQITSGEARRTATQTVTDTTTFAADNTLSCTLIAGRRYRFYIWYAFTTVNSSGVKLDLNGGGATMTAINGTITIFSSAMAVLTAAQITALTSTTGVTASGTLAFAGIEGSLECLGAGTFIPRFAQNAETGAAESVIAQIGSYITLADVP